MARLWTPFIMIFTLGCASPQTRTPSASLPPEDHLRVALMEQIPGETLMVVGLHVEEPQFFQVDFSKLGYRSAHPKQSIKQMNPKYVLRLTPEDGIRTIHSLEYGSFLPAGYKKSCGIKIRKRTAIPKRCKRVDPATASGLPSSQVDIPNAAQDFRAYWIAFQLVELLYYTPAAPAIALIRAIARQDQYHHKEASLSPLRKWVRDALQYEHYEALQFAFGKGQGEDWKDALWRILSGIDARYPPLSDMGTLLSSYKTVHEELTPAAHRKLLTRGSERRGELTETVNRMGPGLKVTHVDDSISILLLDRENPPPGKHWEKYLPHVDKPLDYVKHFDKTENNELQQAAQEQMGGLTLKEARTKFKQISGLKDDRWLPLGVFVTDEYHTIQQMSDTHDPGEFARGQQWASLFLLINDIGYSFIPNPAIVLPLPNTYFSNSYNVLNFALLYFNTKSRDTKSDYKQRAYGRVNATMSGGWGAVDPEAVDLSILLDNLMEFGHNPTEVQAITTELAQAYQGVVIATPEDGLPSPEVLHEFHRKKAKVMRKVLTLTHSYERRGGVAINLLRGSDLELVNQTKTIHLQRLRNYISRKIYGPRVVPRPKKKRKRRPLIRKRRPASEAKATPVIMLLIDGLRPDRFKAAAQRCLELKGTPRYKKDCQLPFLTPLFYERGVEMNSYVSRSLTLPSWATILTGLEHDRHGIKGNFQATRKPDRYRAIKALFSDSQMMSVDEQIINLSDHRRDLFSLPFMTTGGRGQSGQFLADSASPWIAGFPYMNPKESVVTFMPITYGNPPDVPKGIWELLSDAPKMLWGTLDGAHLLDQVNAETAVTKIKEKRGKIKLVATWFTSVDAHSHHSHPEEVTTSLKSIDLAASKVLRQAKRDPLLKDARVILVSDHGHTGGHEPAHQSHYFEKEHIMNNTGVNLTRYFAGEYVSRPNYDFVVHTPENPEGNYDWAYLKEFWLHPFAIDYRGDNSADGDKRKRNLILDFSGDTLAQVYLKHPDKAWEKRPNYHHLRNYKMLDSRGKMQTYDLVGDLLRFQLFHTDNLEIPGKLNDGLGHRLKTVTDMRPVAYVATALHGLPEYHPLLGVSTRPRILITSRGRDDRFKFGVISTKGDKFSYRVYDRFEMTSDGTVNAVPTENISRDPLRYYGQVGDAALLGGYYTDRQWLDLALKANHEEPTIIFGLVRQLTQDPKLLEVNEEFTHDTPDMLLVAHWGFNFNSAAHLTGDHGAYKFEEVRNSFFVSGIGKSFPPYGLKKISTPNLSKDVAPTVLDYLNLDTSLTQGRSFKPEIEEALSR